ncbi:hypothetical protein ACFQZE_12160 [Paenibacillus sp. GCM10027627]|uniref:hypothetical protein n=1 Tax=unclassified Paenibacillus TaxID=185978 RepID=UPI003626CF01
MNAWRGSIFLAKEEFKRAKWKHLLTLFFIAYLSFFLVPMFAEAYTEEEGHFFYWSLDFVALTLLPCLGIMSSQMTGFYWKTDSYSKKLASWRTMPIPVNQIALGRVLLLLLNALPAKTIFFIIFYGLIRTMNVDIELLPFIGFAVFWIGYSTAVGFIYVYCESGFTGKQYFWIIMLFTLVVLTSMIMVTVFAKRSLILTSYYCIEQGGWWLSVVGVLAGAAMLLLGLPMLVKKLKTRNYAS